MSFEQWPMVPSDQESIERFPDEINDDLAGLLTKQFKQLEEHIDAAEARLSTRLADLEALLPKKQ